MDSPVPAQTIAMGVDTSPKDKLLPNIISHFASVHSDQSPSKRKRDNDYLPTLSDYTDNNDLSANIRALLSDF
jgi:hypothetical protein